jgi:hypothetical protein
MGDSPNDNGSGQPLWDSVETAMNPNLKAHAFKPGQSGNPSSV